MTRPKIDETLRAGLERRKIPCVTAMAGDARQVLYAGAFGTRDAQSGMAVPLDAIFAIASMTKAITSTAALQLVEQKKVSLDEPAEKYVAELRGRQVLAGFDSQGRAQLRPPARPVTLRHLLTHTSGLCYPQWEPAMVRWGNSLDVTPTSVAPLVFDPGTQWRYGQGIDVVGRLVEEVSGMWLEEYFQKHVLGPLGMVDTSFWVPPEKFERLVTGYKRQADGTLFPEQRMAPIRPAACNGGGGLFSTAPDYLRFLQAMLRGGEGLVQPATFQLMATNQIGQLRAGILLTTNPARSSDLDIQPGRRKPSHAGICNEPNAARRRARGT